MFKQHTQLPTVLAVFPNMSSGCSVLGSPKTCTVWWKICLLRGTEFWGTSSNEVLILFIQSQSTLQIFPDSVKGNLHSSAAPLHWDPYPQCWKAALCINIPQRRTQQRINAVPSSAVYILSLGKRIWEYAKRHGFSPGTFTYTSLNPFSRQRRASQTHRGLPNCVFTSSGPWPFLRS